MMDRFEQNVRQAYATFIAETERTVIVAIRAAFAEMSTHAVDGGGTPRTESPALDPRAPRHATASRRAPAPSSGSTDLGALRKQLLGCINDIPGSTTAQLGRQLGVHTAKVRRQLVRLQAEGALRAEDRPAGLGGQRCLAYFPGQRELAHVLNVSEQTSAASTGALGESP
jgi:hypothetical protein